MQARARAVMLTNYTEVARHFGLDPYAMLGRCGLHPNSLRDPENWLPGKPLLRLLDDSAAVTGRDDFGVLLGESRTFASLGPVSLLLKHEITLGHIIARAVEYRRLINEMVDVHLRTYRRSAVLEWNLVQGLHSTQAMNILATIAYRILVDGTGCVWQPECVHFRQSSPMHVATFQRVFRCSLEFDSSFDGISFPSRCLDFPNEHADPGLAIHARRLLELVPGIRKEESLTERVRSTIPFLISNGQADVQGVARYLGMPLRTFQRKLAAEGQSFGTLLNEARRELAVRYLANSKQSITMVAQLTGYSALSSFTRWFIAEFGSPPGKWRRTTLARNARHLKSRLASVSRMEPGMFEHFADAPSERASAI
jgi:AraC-like DNA-binding protein